MALRRDYSLTKDIVFEGNEDLIYSLYKKYDLPYVQGQYYKGMLREYITFHKGICGKGEDIKKLFDLLYQYASINITDPNYAFVDEADNLRDAFYGLTEYNKILGVVNEELSRTIDGWLASANPKAANPEQRKQELALIGQIEQIVNRRSFVYESIQLLQIMKDAITQADGLLVKAQEFAKSKDAIKNKNIEQKQEVVKNVQIKQLF